MTWKFAVYEMKETFERDFIIKSLNILLKKAIGNRQVAQAYLEPNPTSKMEFSANKTKFESHWQIFLCT